MPRKRFTEEEKVSAKERNRLKDLERIRLKRTNEAYRARETASKSEYRKKMKIHPSDSSKSSQNVSIENSHEDSGHPSGHELDDELDYDENELQFHTGNKFDAFKHPNRSSDQYNQMIEKMNLKQQQILNLIAHSVRTEQSNPFYIFVSGPAGCGKSFLIDCISETCSRIFDPSSDPSSIKIIRAAPTGRAAHNIRGSTLHGAFALPVTPPKTSPSHPFKDLTQRACKEHRAEYKDVKLILIDEISFVGYRTFQYIDRRLRQIMAVDAPFGGVSVVAFGDLRQIPPVGQIPIYHSSSSETPLWHLFQFYELDDEIMRQKDDSMFATCLNRLADGTMTPEDVRLMKSRQVSNLDDIPPEAIHLFSTNEAVHRFNAQRLSKLKRDGCVVRAIDRRIGKDSKSPQRHTSGERSTTERIDAIPLVSDIPFKISAKYMLVCNVQTDDGLVNGATGTLERIEYCPTKSSPFASGVKRIWIKFDDERVGRTRRHLCRQYMVEKEIDSRCTPIHRETYFIRKNRLPFHRSQFPVVVAEAMTIHKSQGATFPHVAVHLPTQPRRYLLYVAASRATRAGGLYIVGEFRKPSKPRNDPIAKELRRLKSIPNVSLSRLPSERLPLT